MSSRARNLRAPLLSPKAVIFGAATFNLVWVWLRSSEIEFHQYIFMAVLLLASSALILVNRMWSNFLAGAMSGYLPVQFIYEFWMYAKAAEVPIFSYRHISYLFGFDIRGTVLMFLLLTTAILFSAAHSVVLSKPHRHPSEDV